jgi:LmbE family N-acetylglucosaminyl deacetylase
MRWVYLSPHFDDVVLSCGGIVWEQVQAGEVVEIWTICAGAPDVSEPLSDFAKQLHERWQTGLEAVEIRRREDEAAGRVLGARLRYWNLPDCIYRRLPTGQWLVNGEEDLWQPVHPQEEGVIAQMARWMLKGLAYGVKLVCPLTLGNHVDHRLVRTAAEQVVQQLGQPLWFYSDYPYAVRAPAELQDKVSSDWQKECWQVTPAALMAWQEAVASHVSQLSTFWGGLDEMRSALETYWRSGGGSCLWKPPGGLESSNKEGD